MKNINRIKKQVKNKLVGALLIVACITTIACDPTIDSLAFDLPDANSQEDLTPPAAAFTASVTADYLTYTFANESTSATTYAWDFGDGNSSTSVDGLNTYPDEGTYTVTLTASDALGAVNTYTAEVVVEEPEAPPVLDPTLVNADFVKLPKSSGSDCACAAWINKSIGDQGESSSGNGSDVLKFDNNEPDAIYQEFEVVPNANYLITVVSSFKSLESGGLYPSELELRILAGTGYTDGYTPVYYTDTVDFPQGNSDSGFWGYTSIAQVEDEANNLLIRVEDNPSDTSYLSYQYSFNSGANTSVALFMRGLGGPATGGAGGDFGYNSGDEEIRTDSIVITALD
ncbi:PKD domain-containing protein [uncultured Winogradskyella sp.]|uniref:PKD domain-containing protein n=1 Tax=Winogradskyella sp. 4-2091 TaxID=3381659 RepID=UPI002638B8C8|nr:PKD domain-containing protein [uncultured Winogradskyella sp.]